MKVTNFDKEKAVKHIGKVNNYTRHEAIEKWLSMPQKEQRKYIVDCKKRNWKL